MIAGIQISSLKPLLTSEKAVQAAFRTVAGMGCTTVQLQWIDRAVPIESIARALRENGLQSVSVQDLTDTIFSDRDYFIRLNEETGGTWMCLSRIPERFKTPDGLNAFVGELTAFEQELASHGQKLCFHPVAADFEPIGSIHPVEYLLERMPALALCPDLYHLNKRGLSMTAWIERYAGRIPMIHFKDEKDGALVPAGQGDTDWTGVVPACLKANIPFAFVEQERWNRGPFLCLREALDWLNGQILSKCI